MISTTDISLNFGGRKLFVDVNIKFIEGNCYGVIGANGAGKSTFLRILSGEQEATSGRVHIGKKETLSVLKQDHFQYDEETVQQTVLMGNAKLFKVMIEKDEIYSKPDFSEADGVVAAELETDFAALGGWEIEANIATVINGLGLSEEYLTKKMKELKDSEKVKVLLAQALFGKPDNLLLDEPTNHLDAKSINWLEEYILNFPNTVIVVSHDRHFLNKVCTHMVDIDFGKINVFTGNYDFWQQSSILARDLRSAANKKVEDKAKDLEAFIRRFSANASKARQATSRRKQLDNLTLEDMPLSIRKSPHIVFTQRREAGDILLEVNGISKTIAGEKVLDNVSFTIKTGDKVVFVGSNEIAKSTLFHIIMGEMEPDEGSYNWGVTTSQAYLPKDYNHLFDGREENLINWLREFSVDQSENYIRSFLGRMLFSGDETLKSASVLSGGEKVRCMFAKMMLLEANVLVMDGPTNHLDLESITALNDGLIAYKGTILFATHDQDLARTVSSKIIEIDGAKAIDHQLNYTEYLAEAL